MEKTALNKKKTLLTSKLDLKVGDDVLHLEYSCVGCRNLDTSEYTLKVLKRGAGEEWRSVGPIV
jgi:hypothetical protein